MKYEQIRDALTIAGYTWGTAAKVIGKTRGMLITVCQRKNTSRPVAIALSTLIDRPVEEVFPDKPAYHIDVNAERDNKIAEGKKKLADAGLIAA